MNDCFDKPRNIVYKDADMVMEESADVFSNNSVGMQAASKIGF